MSRLRACWVTQAPRRAGGAATAGGPGLLELIATAEHGREAAKAKAKAARRPAGQQARPSPEGQPAAGEPGRGRRKQGGQPGHRGSGLAPVATPDHREPVEPPCCAGCGGDLAGAPGTVGRRVQVFDLPTFSLAITEYQMMRRLCGCGHVTMAGLPAGVRGGPTCYGPNVTAAATLLASQDVLGIERTADLMSALLGVEVSTGFISSCLTRLDTALNGRFEQALKTALGEQQVLGTDETPAPLTDAASSQPDCHNPDVYTMRTMGAYTRGGADLVWYGAAGGRPRSAGSGSSTTFVGCWSATTSAATSATTRTWPGSSNAWPT
jgi:transposase